jgi:hypothetical protein
LDLLVAALPVFLANVGVHGVEDDHTVRKEEWGTRRHLVEEEKFLILADLSVISLCRLFEQELVFLERLLHG